MRKIILFTLTLLLRIGINAQIKTPQASTSQKINQTVGLTDITLEYSKPSMRGRVVFGNLVPYNKTWRTGANANTKISFSERVIIGGTEVKAKVHAMPMNIETFTMSFDVITNDSANLGLL